jgi:hypothetical protein
MIIKTTMTAEICFLFTLNIAQWLILSGANAIDVLGMLIMTRFILIGLSAYYTKRWQN